LTYAAVDNIDEPAAIRTAPSLDLDAADPAAIRTVPNLDLLLILMQLLMKYLTSVKHYYCLPLQMKPCEIDEVFCCAFFMVDQSSDVELLKKKEDFLVVEFC
jgi:hypothetical protein